MQTPVTTSHAAGADAALLDLRVEDVRATRGGAAAPRRALALTGRGLTLASARHALALPGI